MSHSSSVHDFDKHQLSLVVQGITTVRFNGNSCGYPCEPNETTLLIQHNDYSNNTSFREYELLNDINGLIEFYWDENVKYFLWDDYKRIIELSGYIE
ncbi:hypothetical protein Sden_3418 [Shewanella denitrificans OS217]|uniref:Uncharacterized protein n=1 Tax=Shewanella denitrificans (strain OS217 / ATCC BAA-1090 / DSM 15013) TaxID=318161 RepID=Q12IN3_SHEDO|nr:hypothetical protein [Shewanella denitrificans]ABE56693.1 hypothetical protein Sden_3418 [Shewanella denitrificans OS217]